MSVAPHSEVVVGHHPALPREAALLSQQAPSDALYLPGRVVLQLPTHYIGQSKAQVSPLNPVGTRYLLMLSSPREQH